MSRPNIILILIDDLGWRDLGCYGSSFYESPNIDRLASQGIRFTDAYAAAPVCSPTRASIVTGCYPARLHLTDWIPGYVRPDEKLLNPDWSPRLPEGQPTIAGVLRAQGYRTACIGKWHLNGTPLDHGFEVASLFRKIRSHFYPYYSEPPFIEGREGEYFADRLTDEALEFIESSRDRPFFLFMTHNSVHRPLEAHAAAIQKYRDRARPDADQNNPVYAAMVEAVDDSVGRIMARLEDLGISDNTVVVFASDNGGLAKSYNGQVVTSNLPLRHGKGTLYEGGIRVPLILRYPDLVKTPSVSPTPVCSTDLLPTLAALAGVPNDALPRCDGEDISSVLSGSGMPRRECLFWHYPHYHESPPAGAVRKGSYKLLEFFETDSVELYDLSKDIGESEDLSETQRDMAASLRAELIHWRRDVGAQMPVPNPGCAGL